MTRLTAPLPLFVLRLAAAIFVVCAVLSVGAVLFDYVFSPDERDKRRLTDNDFLDRNPIWMPLVNPFLAD